MTTSPDGRLARGELRKLLLLDAAVKVVADGGSGALTHRAVASDAGVSLASVTYHFPSIGDLREAMFDHAGSRVGLAFRDLIETAGTRAEDVPELTAAFSVSLVTERRVDTTAVFEMIVAAGHDASLRPLVRFFNDRLAELLGPYVGERFTALTVAAAIQGLILGYLAQTDVEDAQALHDGITDLVRRYRDDDAIPTP
jgi:DNA-binding transcriptional regulator YbjK